MNCPGCERLTKERDEARSLANAEFVQIQRDLADGMAHNAAGTKENAKLRAEVERHRDANEKLVHERAETEHKLQGELLKAADEMRLILLQLSEVGWAYHILACASPTEHTALCKRVNFSEKRVDLRDEGPGCVHCRVPKGQPRQKARGCECSCHRFED